MACHHSSGGINSTRQCAQQATSKDKNKVCGFSPKQPARHRVALWARSLSLAWLL